MSRRSKRRAKRETADHRDRWMITYADLITLLLIFRHHVRHEQFGYR